MHTYLLPTTLQPYWLPKPEASGRDMLRAHHPARRRSGYAPQLCIAVAAILLLFLSLSVLHSRLSSSSPSLNLTLGFNTKTDNHNSSVYALFDDADSNDFDGAGEDRIDELDDIEEESSGKDGQRKGSSDEDEFLRSAANLDDDSDSDEAPERSSGSGFFWDHALGVARRSLGKPGQEQRQQPLLSEEILLMRTRDSSRVVTAFGSDDQPVDEGVRAKMDSIRRIEDTLLLQSSPLREGWDRWLEGKADFLRRDPMLRSNLEMLNPKNHPLLQDPDGPSLATLTRGDRLMQKAIWTELEKTPFPPRRQGGGDGKFSKDQHVIGGSAKFSKDRRRTLDSEADKEKRMKTQKEQLLHKADKRKWGYFPGLDPHLPFSAFMDQFLGDSRCSLRVFMAWNSPPWMYGVRHQRGLESLLHHHRDACIVMFSETMELEFFHDFVKEGFRIAVVMPNLDELLKDTPAQIFASVWFEWRKTKFYPIHYSELVRLAALYKYGGIYLDSDIIVLKPLHSLRNSVAMNEEMSGNSLYSGAVMAFEKKSSFMMECLQEFYSTYDDTHLRWNGADLMSRVIKRVSAKVDKSSRLVEIKLEHPFVFFPISSQNIIRYFAPASDKLESAHQDALFRKIINESITFHFWNDITSTLVPEPESLVERLLNQYCLHCRDVL